MPSRFLPPGGLVCPPTPASGTGICLRPGSCAKRCGSAFALRRMSCQACPLVVPGPKELARCYWFFLVRVPADRESAGFVARNLSLFRVSTGGTAWPYRGCGDCCCMFLAKHWSYPISVATVGFDGHSTAPRQCRS